VLEQRGLSSLYVLRESGAGCVLREGVAKGEEVCTKERCCYLTRKPTI
jgi:hypothetical protein